MQLSLKYFLLVSIIESGVISFKPSLIQPTYCTSPQVKNCRIILNQYGSGTRFRSWDDNKASNNDKRRDRFDGDPSRKRRRESDDVSKRDALQWSPSQQSNRPVVQVPLLGATTTFESQTSNQEDLEHFFSVKDFRDIGANSLAIEALQVLGISRPSKIQAASYQSVLDGHHCVIAEQTGSGKTLAYLLPLIQRLKSQELVAQTKEAHKSESIRSEKGPHLAGRAKPGRPRVLILSPTSELAQQVHSIVRRLSGVARLRTCCFTGGGGVKSQASLLNEGVDVLVATPGRVGTLLETGTLSMADCSAVVLDEVDVLYLDDTFKLAPIGAQAPDGAQFLFVTATLPAEVSEMLKAEFPGTKFITGPGLHRVAPGVEEVLVDCSGPPEEEKNEKTGFARKREALITQLTRRSGSLRTLIFCNTIRSCREVENALRRADRNSARFSLLAYHSAIDPSISANNLREFSRSNALRPMIMICTDRSSRGMDFENSPVDHVVLYDFPRDPIEYMRRVGRTARAGRKGIVTVLAWGRQVPLAREIMAGNKLGKRLLTIDE